MTTEGGSRRYYGAIEVPPDGYVPGELLEARFLDPIRAAALTAAVELLTGVQITELRSDDDIPGLTIVWATALERYLNGEEADDPTNP